MTSKFEVARGQKIQRLPDEASIRKVFDIVAQMPQDQDYAAESFKEVLKANNLKDEHKVLEQFSQFTALVQESRNKSSKDVWEGMEPDNQFNVFVDALAKQTTDLLVQQGETPEAINVEFAMNDNSQFRRGYSLGEKFKSLDENQGKQLDILFIAWLKNNDYVSKDGFIYRGKGTNIDVDNKTGKPILVDPMEFQNKFLDDKNGFGAKASEAGLNVNVLRREFPEEEAAPGKHG